MVAPNPLCMEARHKPGSAPRDPGFALTQTSKAGSEGEGQDETLEQPVFLESEHRTISGRNHSHALYILLCPWTPPQISPYAFTDYQFFSR